MDQSALQAAEKELARLDPILGALIATQKLDIRRPRDDYFISLSRSIIGQQVSVAAANAIFGRFETMTKLDPHMVVTLEEEAIKTVGLSRQKAGYLKDLAQHFVDDPTVYNHLDKQTDDQVIAELTDVKGIGVWTAQMFLMFTLNRPDIFAPDDVGLQRAMIKLYGWETVLPKKELVAFAEQWQPYRTVASLHLWHSLDNNPI
jgi:DNA-3-methyladenine glycosylase II